MELPLSIPQAHIDLRYQAALELANAVDSVRIMALGPTPIPQPLKDRVKRAMDHWEKLQF